jgi:AraC-like DNA-binding protein
LSLAPRFDAWRKESHSDSRYAMSVDWRGRYGSVKLRQMDVLSDVLTAIQLTGAVFFDIEAFSPWVGVTPHVEQFRSAVMPNAEHVIAFHVVLAGSCWAEVPDVAPPTRLNARDLVVVPMGDPHVLSSDPGMRGEPFLDAYRRPADGTLPVPYVLNRGGGPARSHFVCGYFACARRPFNPLLDALPRMFHRSVSASSQDWMLSLVRAAASETQQNNAGGETMLAKVAELMFVEVVRKYIDDMPEGERGWCSGLRDPQVGAAIALIHNRPAYPWTVETLAHGVGMCRSIFAERFMYLVGSPPMQYLAKWRLQLASNLLMNRGMSIAKAAAEVGYESEAAFNRAFKKIVGVPPGVWRTNRLDVSVAAGPLLNQSASLPR